MSTGRERTIRLASESLFGLLDTPFICTQAENRIRETRQNGALNF